MFTKKKLEPEHWLIGCFYYIHNTDCTRSKWLIGTGKINNDMRHKAKKIMEAVYRDFKTKKFIETNYSMIRCSEIKNINFGFEEVE